MHNLARQFEFTDKTNTLAGYKIHRRGQAATG